MLPDTNVYTDYYNVQPALATSFAECYKRTVVPANDPGEYKGNVTVNSDIWRCDLVGNYSGSNSFQYPDQVVLFNDAEQVGGRFSFLGVAGLVSLFALKASIGIWKVRSRPWYWPRQTYSRLTLNPHFQSGMEFRINIGRGTGNNHEWQLYKGLDYLYRCEVHLLKLQFPKAE
jgi:hypothetical protein